MNCVQLRHTGYNATSVCHTVAMKQLLTSAMWNSRYCISSSKKIKYLQQQLETITYTNMYKWILRETASITCKVSQPNCRPFTNTTQVTNLHSERVPRPVFNLIPGGMVQWRMLSIGRHMLDGFLRLSVVINDGGLSSLLNI